MAFGPVSIGGSSYVLPPATKNALGGVIVGENLTVSEMGEIDVPVATKNTLGGIKSGKGLKISADGTASIDAYNTSETDSLLNVLQKQVDRKISSAISSATSITASGDGYIRFADGTQICWLKFCEWHRVNYKPYFPFPVPFANTNYGAGFTLGQSITYSSNTECYIYDYTTTGLTLLNEYKGSIVVIGRWK